MEKTKRKYSKTDRLILGIGYHASWVVCAFYRDSDRVCNTGILYGSYGFK